MKVLIPLKGVLNRVPVLCGGSDSIERLALSARWNIVYVVHVKEDGKCLDLVEDPVVHRNHSKLLLRSRKLR